MAIATNYNIKQITGYDIADKISFNKAIIVPKRTDIAPYGIIQVIESIPYKTALENVSILKFGYCCEPKAIIYPIYLEINGSYEEIKVGRDGMYEMQPESWKDINNQESEESTTNITITGVQVPADINFTIDYVVPIN